MIKKPLLLFSFILLVAATNSFGQDNMEVINAKWSNLKTQLQKRADVVTNLTHTLPQASKEGQEAFTNAKAAAAELVTFMTPLQVVDSVSIKTVYAKNRQLTQTLSGVLLTLEASEKDKGSQAMRQLQSQLEGCESRIFTAKEVYNNTCNKYKKPGLYFGTFRPSVETSPVLQ